jgi:hypothetical protein
MPGAQNMPSLIYCLAFNGILGVYKERRSPQFHVASLSIWAASNSRINFSSIVVTPDKTLKSFKPYE